ncbi:MAG TPA: BMP family ABC transporter substrate-binding protein [Anaerolineae bacterium]|nr:BMP family ABC transporter substrate-binding protein [Anaerolineae bacterium]
MGLRYFDEADADLFFGRELLTAKLVGHLRDHHFLAVIVGASGSGKSSIVRAGLIPALKRGEPLADGTLPPEGCAYWPAHVITPTAHPLEALAISLTRDAESVAAIATLMDDLARDPRSLHLFVRRRRGTQGTQGTQETQETRGDQVGGHLLLVVDQFEELFTLCRDEAERKAFIDNLLTATVPSVPSVPSAQSAGETPTIVVLTLRADFYAHCAQYANLREALAKHQEYIGPMSAEELRRAIEEPARRGGWEFEPGLVDLFLREVGDEPGALPLLSHALLETWQRRRGRTMTLKGYAESGGVRGAIAKTAETVFNHQLTPEQQAIARSVFLRLTELGEGTQDTRRRAALNELIPNPQLQPSVELVLKILADARLITTSENTIEVAHEALIREWPTLRQWLDEDREGLRLHRHLTEAAQAWDELDRDPGEVYRGARLAQATEWAATHASELNALERAFLDASQAWAELEEAEREAQRQRELEAAQRLAEAERLRAEAEKQRAEGQTRAAWQLRRRALYLTGAFVLALVMAGATLFFGEQARQAAITAQANERVAFSRELAAAAISNLDADPERSILLALQAVTETYSAGLPVPLQAEDALHQAVLTSRVQLVLRGHGDGQVVAVTFSPDGTRLATFSEDEITKVWDAITGRELLTLPGYFAAFSPDGTRLATVVADGAVKMWDAATGHELTLAGRVEAGIGVDFSPDGMHLATAPGKVAKVWDASTGQELLTLSGHTEFVGFAVFSPDGQRLVTASDDKTARVWDATTGEELLSLPHTDWVLYATFGPDGKRVATVSGGSAKVWDATTGEALFTLAGHTNVIYGVTFSPDGTRLATGSLDREVKVWDATNGQELFTLSGHTGAIYGLSFSPDGTRLATGSVDGTVRVWDVSPSREALTLPTPDGSSGRVVFSPDGARLAAGFGVEGVVKVWDVATGQTLLTLAGHTSPVAGVAFSPDGTHLATGAADGTVKLWDAATGQELLALSGHDSWVNSVAFSPDGTRLATSSDDYTARIWDATSGRELHKLSHTREVPAVAFSPDGTRLATGVLNGTAKVWDASTGKELLTLRGHSDTVWGVAFSLDGTRLATASQDGTAKVWDAATGQELLTLPGHTSTVVTVAFSPDGSRLATASRDGTAKIWDTATGQELLPLYGDGSGLNGIAFSPDGTRLATGGNQAVRVYLMWIEDLVALARTRVTRSLTTGECQQYLRLAQCPGGTAPATRMPTAATAPTTAAAQPPAAKGKVCQVAEGSVYDGFFNELAYTGVQDAAETFEWEDAVLESSTPTAFDRNTQEFLEANCDLIVVTTFGLADITRAAAETNPNQKFQVMDRPYDLALDNVWAEVYAVDQAAFLSGYVAASVTKTGKVGTFGGIGIPPVTDFMNGFALGVAYYNEKNGASIEVMGWDVKQQDGLFVGNFCCVAEGRQMAERLLDEGADIILPVAGPTVGSGAAEAAQAHGDAYLIGVDTNYAVSFPEYADIILTSIEKRLDVSVVLAVKAIVDGTFTGGTHVGTLENSGVGISPFHNLDALVSPEVKADLEQIKADIIAGKIKTK